MPGLNEMAYYGADAGNANYEPPPQSYKQTRKNLQSIGRGLSYIPQDLVGGLVDLANLGLLGVDFALKTKFHQQRPVGGSDWWIDKSHQLAPSIVPARTDDAHELGGRILGAAFNPAGAVRKTAQIAEAASPYIKQAAQTTLAEIAQGAERLHPNMYGVPQLAEVGVPRGMRNPEGPTSGGGPMYAVKPKGGSYHPDADYSFTAPYIKDKDEMHLQDVFDLQLSPAQHQEKAQLFTRLMEEDFAKNPEAAAQRPALYYEKQASDQMAKEYGLKTLDDFDRDRQVYNQWVEKTLLKYQRNLMATPEDPLRQLADTPINRWVEGLPENWLPNTENTGVAESRIAAGYKPEGFATTPAGKFHEFWTDFRTAQPRSLGDIVADEKVSKDWLAENPWIQKQAEKDPNQLMYMGALDDNRTIASIAKEALKLAEEGRMTAENFTTFVPEVVARKAHERVLADEAAALGSEADVRQWAERRSSELPANRKFDDGSKVIILNDSLDPELLKADLSLQTIACNHCVGSAGYDSGKFTPMVLPHTGKPPAGAVEGHGTDYYQRILDGELEIRYISDEKGWPQATMEWENRYDDTFDVEQIKGKDNGPIPEKYRQNLLDYLNENQFIINKINEDDLAQNKIRRLDESGLKDALYKLAGESTEKEKRLLQKITDRINRDAQRNGRTWRIKANEALDQIANDDYANGTQYVMEDKADEVYEKSLKRYLQD